MPYGNVVDIGVLFTDIVHRALETSWEVLGVGLELTPPSVGLALAVFLHRLPVVVNDKVGDMDIVSGQLFEGVKEFLVRQVLAEGVPCACQWLGQGHPTVKLRK